MKYNRYHLLVDAAERIGRGRLQRKPRWTKSRALGSRQFVERIQPLILTRREMEDVMTTDHTCVLREVGPLYGQDLSSNTNPKA
ncbi:MAG: hypothetical protein GX456_10980 [Verrucomicrobia bacterium]|nr:hypothetical protein [Verrucomicrobiota bacterium]